MLKFEIFLARRYLSGRSSFLRVMNVLSTLGVMIGVGALVVILSVMNGMRRAIKEKILGTSPHVMVFSFDGQIENWREVVQKINEVDGVKSAFPLVVANAIARHKHLTASVVVQCLDASLTQKAIELEKFLRKGEVFSEGKIDVGIWLAKNLSVDVGDELVLISPYGDTTVFGYIPSASKFEVGGIFEVGIFDWDSVFVFMTLADCHKLFGIEGFVTTVGVMLRDPDIAFEVSRKIQDVLGEEFLVKPWMELQKNLFSAMQLEKIGMAILLTIIIIVASFNIFSTITVLVRDKEKEIAVMKVFGMQTSSLKRIFTLVGVLIGLRGIFLGTLVGLFVCWILSKYKIITLPADVYYITYLPVDVEVFDIVLVWCLALLISFLSSYIPSAKAVSKQPFEVLRRE